MARTANDPGDSGSFFDKPFNKLRDRLQFIFLELTNCRVLTPESTVLEKVCYALHNMENLPDRPEGFEGELFRLLFESAESSTFTPQDKDKLALDMRTERDFKNQMAYAEEKAREEGREEERARIIEELRKQGYPEEMITRLARKD